MRMVRDACDDTGRHGRLVLVKIVMATLTCLAIQHEDYMLHAAMLNYDRTSARRTVAGKNRETQSPPDVPQTTEHETQHP